MLSTGAVLASLGADAAHLPTPALIGSLAVGLGYALSRAPDLALPRVASWSANVLIGIAAGVTILGSTLRSVAAVWAPVLATTLLALLLSVALGLGLARLTSVDRATSLLGMVAGGAPGVISIARDLNADERLVAVMQYLRVFIILSTLPFIADAFFDVGSQSSTALQRQADWSESLPLIVTCTALAAVLSRPLRVPGGSPLLVAMIVAATASITGFLETNAMPSLALKLALGVIGLQIGLRFTPQTMRHAGAIAPITALLIVVMMLLSGALGVVLSTLADVSLLDGYLATTPGGLSAVIGLTLTSNSDSAFVTSVQAFRLLIMLLVAPILVRKLCSTARDA